MMGLFSKATVRCLTGAIIGTVVLLGSASAIAQQSMTVEELEAYIAKKKAELDTAIEQRDATLEQQQELQRKQDEQNARQAKIEQELRALCDEREESEPGSLDSCLKEMNLAAE